MAAGRPIVANAIGDLNAIISKYHCGILLDSVQPHTISDALGKLENPALRAELGGAGEQAARESYNWGEVAKELIKTYEQLQRI
jgi:glycosyltransferase involved in cell wall biosynthesis